MERALTKKLMFNARRFLVMLWVRNSKAMFSKSPEIVTNRVAWLYNIRGNDVAYCPVVHAFAIVTLNSAFIYVDKRKVSIEAKAHLEENGIEIREYTAISSDAALLATGDLDAVSTAKDTQAEVSKESEKIPIETNKSANGRHQTRENSNNLVWADPGCCYALYSKLNAETVLLQQSPLALAKALKNSVELDGLKKAHIRDGAAVVQYLVWLDKMQDIYGAPGYFLEESTVKKEKPLQSVKLTEVTVSDKLEAFRASKEYLDGMEQLILQEQFISGNLRLMKKHVIQQS